ncbi:MAG: hypothetical protein G01um101417_470 [Parcubacteria group bacterium Gr01-1014_17]|nr:MAG: hypothetical protein G01um101417_470 [Parcubacteria group bacterium Gr01-1014_17]
MLRRISKNSGFLEPSKHKNLRIFHRVKKTGIITEVSMVGRENLTRPLGCLSASFLTQDGKTEVFQTKLRRGIKLRAGQHVAIWTLELHASAWDYQFNVVRIDVDGQTVYRWSPKEVLYSYARC